MLPYSQILTVRQVPFEIVSRAHEQPFVAGKILVSPMAASGL
jgi:hypothetical protein